MARYFFDLMLSQDLIEDSEGTELTSDHEARQHARIVARELMKAREAVCRDWRIRVCDGSHSPLFSVLFAQEDETRLSTDPRMTAQELSASFARPWDTTDNDHSRIELPHRPPGRSRH